MSNAAKTKGKSYETKIAKLLQKWFYENNMEYKSLFNMINNEDLAPKRDSSSGTFVSSSGDIELGLLKNFFPYSIECKHWKSLDLTLNQILKNDAKSVKDVFYNQCVPAANKKNLKPIVVFSANRTEIFCFLENNSFYKMPKKFIMIDKCFICLFKDFLEENY